MAKRVCVKAAPPPPPPPRSGSPFVLPVGASRYFAYLHLGRDVARLALNAEGMIHFQSGADYGYQNSGWHGCWREDVTADGSIKMRLMFRHCGNSADMLRNINLVWDPYCRQYAAETSPIAMKELDHRMPGAYVDGNSDSSWSSDEYVVHPAVY